MQDIYKNIEENNGDRKQKYKLVFDYMICNIISNKKTKSNSNWAIFQRRENNYFYNFYYTILFCSTKKC